AGPAGVALVDRVSHAGGVVTAADLATATATATWEPAVCRLVGGHRVWTTPAPTYGPALLRTLTESLDGLAPDGVAPHGVAPHGVAPDGGPVLPATVVRSTRVTPRTVRVTIGGPDLARFRPLGFDQWFRLFIQQDGQDTFRKPGFSGFATFVHLRAMPKSVRPLMRNYTVRAYRADPPEI
nr:siderophore-interacting protein [Micromonospora sp. DSM 115978]